MKSLNIAATELQNQGFNASAPAKALHSISNALYLFSKIPEEEYKDLSSVLPDALAYASYQILECIEDTERFMANR